MNAIDEHTLEKSRRDLAAGVLKQAAQDLRRFRGGWTAIEQELYRDAYDWVTADDLSSPFSFSNVCQLLNLAPETVRQQLLGEQSLGLLDYWSRRCGRAVRSFQTFVNRRFTANRTPKAVDPIPLTVHSVQ